jgi:Glycosyltransferase sugar-binding region containing DXD motif
VFSKNLKNQNISEALERLVIKFQHYADENKDKFRAAFYKESGADTSTIWCAVSNILETSSKNYVKNIDIIKTIQYVYGILKQSELPTESLPDGYFLRVPENSCIAYWYTNDLVDLFETELLLLDYELPDDIFKEAPPVIYTEKASGQRTLEDIKEPPHKIHFIWMGKNIPSKYLVNIIQFYRQSREKDFEINLWTDRAASFYKTFYEGASPETSFFDAAPDFKNAIKLRNINELYDNMRAYHQTKGRWEQLATALSRESIGSKNLGAKSDFLRIEILRQEGGVYIDTDDQARRKGEHDFQALEPTVSYLPKSEFELPNLKYGFGCGKNKYSTGNDIIVSAPQHPILDNITDDMLKAYAELDEEWVKRKNIKVEGMASYSYVTLMDIKRSYETGDYIGFHGKIAPRFRQREPYRVQLTISASGPGIVWKAMSNFAKENAISKKDLYLGDEFFANKVISNSDKSWVKGNPQSFTDEDISYGSRRRF